MKLLKLGDSLVVWKLDRLGRSVRHLIGLIEELKGKSVHFRSLTDSIDAGTAMGRFFFHVMGALAEMERELLVERTMADLAAARAEGRIGGCLVMTADVVARARRMFANGATVNQAALFCEVSTKTIYKYVPAAEQALLRGANK